MLEINGAKNMRVATNIKVVPSQWVLKKLFREPKSVIDFFRTAEKVLFTEDIEFNDFPNCSNAVAQADLFALFFAAAIVRDANFVNAGVGFGNASSYFWLKAETLGL